MITPPLFGWGPMANKSPSDVSLKGRCLCGCHGKEPRPNHAEGAAFCRPCLEERNQPWTEVVDSMLS